MHVVDEREAMMAMHANDPELLAAAVQLCDRAEAWKKMLKGYY